MPLPRDVPDADRDVAEHPLRRCLERADGEREQIRRQRRRRGEADDPAVANLFLPLDRAVRDGALAVAHGDGDTEARLERGLVEAGKDAARVRGLALRESVAAPVRARRVEAAEVLIQAAVEGEHEDGVAGRQREREAEPDRLVVAPRGDPRRPLLAANARDGARDVQVGGVEDDLGARPLEPHRDRHLAAERAALEIRRELEVVLHRPDIGRQTETRGTARGRHRRICPVGVPLPLAREGRPCNPGVVPAADQALRRRTSHTPRRISSRRRRWYSRL